ncbi:hypothetical protein HCC26_00620 [Streptococcus suis]|nr:hypothetical protein [Streptococcus suis]
MQILWLAQAATDRAVTIHSCRFYFTKSKKALRSNFGRGERKASSYSKNLLCSKSLYYTHFIKFERVNQWHILEKEITVGNTQISS